MMMMIDANVIVTDTKPTATSVKRKTMLSCDGCQRGLLTMQEPYDYHDAYAGTQWNLNALPCADTAAI
jgi:hypothetical protein